MRRAQTSPALAPTLVAPAGTPAAPAEVSGADLPRQPRADVQAGRRAIVAATRGPTGAGGQRCWPVRRECRNDMVELDLASGIPLAASVE